MATEATASDKLEIRNALRKYKKEQNESKSKVDEVLKLEKKADMFSKWTVILIVVLAIVIILTIYLIYIKPSLTGKWIGGFEKEIKMKHNKLTDSVFIEEGEGPGEEGRGNVNKYGKVKNAKNRNVKLFKITKKHKKKYGNEAIGLWNMKDTIIWHFPRNRYNEVWHREHQIN